jgi:glycosyltransferase involved in cell wall biosynthesis
MFTKIVVWYRKNFQEKNGRLEVMRKMNLKKILLLALGIFQHTFSDIQTHKTDLIIFSYDRPLQLHALLTSINTYLYNLNDIYVLYRTSNNDFEKAYNEVFSLYQHVVRIKQGKEPKKDFKPLLLRCLNNQSSDHVVFSTDDLLVKDYVDINQCVNALEISNAYGFYLRLGTNITYSYNQNIALKAPKLMFVLPGIFSFIFEQGKSYWGYPHSLDMVLFKKASIMPLLNELAYHSPNVLESRWARHADKLKTGLCFKNSKAFNIPINLVQEDWHNKNEELFTPMQLLHFWNQGLMMNLQPYHHVINNSAMMDYVPTFISRPLENIPEKKITVIIPSYNNAPCFKSNIKSVLDQHYNNYHIIYIDDASSDNTGILVEKFITDNFLHDKITLIKNEYNRKALANVYKAVHMCDPEDIIVELDGDDSLAHPHIFKEINQLFSSYDIWLAYAQYKNVPEDIAHQNKISTIGYAKPTSSDLILSRNFRGKWLWSGLRMFYAWLVQEIKLEDLLLADEPYKGKFFPTSKDAALIYPMLEMAGNKCLFVPSLWLLRNVDTPYNDFKIARDLQKHCGNFLKNSPCYTILDKPISQDKTHDQRSLFSTDFIIISQSAPLLEQHLNSLFTYCSDTKELYVLFDSKQEAHYEKIRANYPTITFIAHQNSSITLADALKQAVTTDSRFVAIMHDTHNLSKPFSPTVCAQELERTGAHAFSA